MRKKISSFNLKAIVSVMLVALVLCSLIGGTVAWLITKTDPVKNTFTYGDINIELEETETEDDDDDPNTNEYPMIPGKPITKDPKVTVKANSENAWLFVKLEKSENFDQFMEYTVILDDPATNDIVEGWTVLDETNHPGVYYIEVSKSNADVEYYVLTNNTVFVKGDVTKEMLNALDKNADGTDKTDKTYPTLNVTAYAVQRDGDIEAINTAAEAWALAIGSTN